MSENINGPMLAASLDDLKYLVFQGMAGKAPRVNAANNHWDVWDAETAQWVDTGVAAIGESDISEDVKSALLACFENVAWINADGQTYYNALYAALYPPKTLVSISAAFHQGSAVICSTDSLDALKPYLTVTAHYDDSSTGAVTNYTLAGTLTEGTSTITVLYSGKTTTFTVNVTAPAALASISAAFTQGDAVIYNTDSLDTLKQYLVVTAAMTDSTTRTVTNYTLSGTLTVGTSTITVSYGGKTTTFSVTVTQRGSDTDYWADGVAYRNIRVIEKQYCRAMDGAMITSQSWCRTDYVNCEGAASISFPPLPQQESGKVTSNWFFDANHNPVQQIELYKTESATITVPQNAAYFVVSNEPAAMQTFLNGDIIPHSNA